MIALASVFYLCLCACLALQSLRCVPQNGPHNGLLRLQVFTVSFFVVFFLGFYIPGYLSLATGLHVVTVYYAVCTLLIITSASLFVTPRPTVSMHAQQLFSVFYCANLRKFVPAATALTFGAVAIMLTFGFPQGYEVMAYHLPGAVEILQSHSLKSWDGNNPHTFPANAGIFFSFFLGFLPEKVVSAANFAFLFPLVLSVVAISRRVGGDRDASLLVACGLVTVPMIAFLSVELSADIAGIAFISAAMYFAVTRAPSPGMGTVLAGLCAGLALGFKSLHLVSIGFLTLVIFMRSFDFRRAALAECVAGIRRSSIFLAGVALTAGFWLIRNYIEFGNPLYPVSLPILSDMLGWSKAADINFSNRHATQFEWVRSSAEWLIYPWVEWQNIGQNFKHSSGLGAFVAASVPASLLAVSAVIARVGVGLHRERLILLLAVAFTCTIWWVLDDRQPRYVLAALPYCMPLVAWVVTQADPKWRGTLNTILGLCITAMLMIFMSKQALVFGDKILLSRLTTRALFYEYPPVIDALSPPATILNLADRSWHYPLAGSRLSNRIISMPEGRRILGMEPSLTAPQQATLRTSPLKALGVTHIFTAGTVLLPDSCMRLEEVGRTARNPGNGVLLAKPRLLFAVTYSKPAASGACQ